MEVGGQSNYKSYACVFVVLQETRNPSLNMFASCIFLMNLILLWEKILGFKLTQVQVVKVVSILKFIHNYF